MKPTGIIRHVDELGRIVIPIEMRRKLNIQEYEALEMFKVNDNVVIKKYDKINVKENKSIIRKIDELGRIVMPKEWRQMLELQTDSAVEVLLQIGEIEIKKYMPYCVFCGNNTKLFDYASKKVCINCIKTLEKVEKNDVI